ncbi:sialate O-acetylesterase [Serratia sp. 1D1416]|uniref:sialate O-acetylesterase n=1 Tax=Serratia sp. 1D1416 TaxID=2447890 RepID=UPI001013CA52|nr:sialate O-acetylesterase [Serratia sp. 1D1416]
MSTEQRYGNRGFSTNNNSGSSDTDTLVPLVEKRYQPAEGTWPAAETPVTGATHKLVEMIQAETGLSFDKQPSAYIGSAPGTGGQPIKNLIKGTAAYSRMIAHVTNSLRLAAAEGRTFAELAVVWMQGESDYRDETSRAEYLAVYLQYIADSLADKKSITGQLFDPIFISYQLSTHRAYRRRDPLIALALRDAAMLGKTEIAYPGYIGDYYGSDHIHGMPETYYMFSQYTGRMIYKKRKDMLDGVTRMHRLDVIDEIRQGIFTMLYFNVPTPPLVFDTEWVAPAENMGFYIRDQFSLDVVEIITSVDIAGPDRVRITTSRPLLSNEIVTYGWGKAGDPMTNGRQTGPRGNLRDSEGDLPGESYTDGAGVLRKLHNWCVIF